MLRVLGRINGGIARADLDRIEAQDRSDRRARVERENAAALWQQVGSVKRARLGGASLWNDLKISPDGRRAVGLVKVPLLDAGEYLLDTTTGATVALVGAKGTSSGNSMLSFPNSPVHPGPRFSSDGVAIEIFLNEGRFRRLDSETGALLSELDLGVKIKTGVVFSEWSDPACARGRGPTPLGNRCCVWRVAAAH